jgi:hypothetical protein
MGLKDDKKCDGCGADLRGSPIPKDILHCYNHGPNGEFLATIEDYEAVADQIENPTTHFSRVIGVEYDYTSPNRFDGVSEWVCPDCGRREGRFSGKVLEDGEEEVRPR